MPWVPVEFPLPVEAALDSSAGEVLDPLPQMMLESGIQPPEPSGFEWLLIFPAAKS